MSKQKSTQERVISLIPNNYEEQPGEIEGKARVFKEKVAARFDELETLGKFLTIFQVILVCVRSHIFLFWVRCICFTRAWQVF